MHHSSECGSTVKRSPVSYFYGTLAPHPSNQQTKSKGAAQSLRETNPRPNKMNRRSRALRTQSSHACHHLLLSKQESTQQSTRRCVRKNGRASRGASIKSTSINGPTYTHRHRRMNRCSSTPNIDKGVKSHKHLCSIIHHML